MSEKVNQWANAPGSRLIKAKSNPNVSRAPLSMAKKKDTGQTVKPKCPKAPNSTKIPSRTPSCIDTTQLVQAKNRATAPVTKQKIPTGSYRAETKVLPVKTEARTLMRKDSKMSASCTILEERALLKKGLNYTPDKTKKPEVGKRTLDRCSSLSSVSLDSKSGRHTFYKGSMRDLSFSEPKKSVGTVRTETKKLSPMNRSTSLWNVGCPRIEPFGSRSPGSLISAGSGTRPSRIPLLAQNKKYLGRSLADLSQVDRAKETTLRVIELDLDLDRSMDERIYENCRETVAPPPKYREPIIPEPRIDLQELTERLMAQLDDDDDQITVPTDTALPVLRGNSATSGIIKENHCRKIDDSSDLGKTTESQDSRRIGKANNLEESTRSKDSLQRSKDSGNITRVDGAKTTGSNGARDEVDSELSRSLKSPKLSVSSIGEKKKIDETRNIKDLRRNWELLQGKADVLENGQENTIPGQRSGKPVEVTSQKLTFVGLEMCQEESKRKLQSPGKRAKEIENLVNFFNCKNAEVAEAAARDSWMRSKEIIESPLKKTEKRKIGSESNGYASDGNCSEDSGHMSNENDVDWKEKDRVVEVFDNESNLETIDTKKNILLCSSSISSDPSSIESSREDIPGNAYDKDWQNPRDSKAVQIFFRSGALEQLESHRDEKLTGHIILLQARCRGYLARRKLNTLKLQDLAVRCIQRNVRKLMSVREWPWWRLYVKVAPLLNVHRTEDQLKARTEELEVLRAKVERLEQERNHLKHDNDKLEAKLSEMTADYAEEHSTSTLAAERIDAETSERLRLERELQDVTEANKNLQQTTERLEMELLYARAADLNGVASDGEDGEDGGVYRQRYEHAIRELEFTKRKMAQQHEDDLEQLVGLKKQLEKKLADAYEEVEEQRQVVGQWKRRVQKLNGEMHDLRLLLEEQTARNNLLEKKQRKFDSETQNLMNDLRQEKAQRERLAREKEIAVAEKFTIEQNLSDARLEIELKEERLKTLTQELEELTFGGKTEEEVALLKKAKHELEKRAKDQEEELDDLAGQVQLLEQAKLRLEMSIEQQRKEMRKEMQQRDEELEEVRGNAHKKVKALEGQLENEHEERTIILREKHELERRLVAYEEQDRVDRAAEAETMQRLKRDLKRTRALLRDAQTVIERSKADSTGKAALRQLKNQLEDAECARAVAVKAKQALEQELGETQVALEEAMRQRSEAEDRANVANRERSELLSQLEENEEELAEVLKKYRAAVQQVSAEQTHLQEAQLQIAALESEKSSLKDQLSELSQRLESVEQLGDPTANSLATRRLEFRAKELESKLELEQTTRARLETQIARLKENVEKLQTETALLRTKEQTAQDAAKRLQRSLRDSREEANSAVSREQEATRARRDLEKALEAAEAETKVVRDDLRLALQRIDDLQSAIQGELDLDVSEEATSENSDSD